MTQLRTSQRSAPEQLSPIRENCSRDDVNVDAVTAR